MAITLIAHAAAHAAADTDSPITIGAVDTTGATLYVMAVACFYAAAPLTISDSVGNVWTRGATIDEGSGVRKLTFFYCVSPLTSATYTASVDGTVNAGGLNLGIVFAALNPPDASFDQVVGNHSFTTTLAAGSLTPSYATNLVLALLGGNFETSVSINGGFAIADTWLHDDVTNHAQGASIAWLEQTSATAQNPTWTVGGNDASIEGFLVIFQTGGVAGGTTATLDALTSTATGVVMDVIHGTAAVTLDALTAGATGSVSVSGQEAGTLDPLTVVATGTVAFTGTASVTLDSLGISATGTVTTAGGLAVTLDSLSGGGTGITVPVTMLTPTVTDDGWGGTVTLAWTQVSGPSGAIIYSPSSAVTAVSLPDVTAVFLFQLTATRTDGFTAISRWRVQTFASAGTPYGDDGSTNIGPITMTANGVEMPAAIINSVNVSKPLSSNPTCSFTLFDADVVEGNDIELYRNGVKLFGGVCLTSVLSFNEQNKFYAISCVGFAWHLHRTMVTKTYLATDPGFPSMSNIITDLMLLASGAIGELFVSDGLPPVSIAFVDTYIDDALTQLANMIPNGHWKVDDNKQLHFGSVEDVSLDPWPLSPQHPWFRDLVITRDLTPIVNRVFVRHTVLETTDVQVDFEIQVTDRAPYDALLAAIDDTGNNYAETTINGQKIQFTGVTERILNGVYGVVNAEFDVIPATVVDGELVGQIQYTDFYDGLAGAPGAPTTGAFIGSSGAGAIGVFSQPTRLVPPLMSYGLTLVTADGETPFITSTNAGVLAAPHNAWLITLSALTMGGGEIGDLSAFPGARRITKINVYGSEDGAEPNLIGSFDPHGGIVIDSVLPEHRTTVVPPPTTNTADPMSYFLTGCTGRTTAPVTTIIQVDDQASQNDLRTRLGSIDDGVVAQIIEGGEITTEEATSFGQAFLARSSAVRLKVDVTVRDDKCQPGQMLGVFFPDYNVNAALKIQQATLTGFEKDIPHLWAVSAAPEVVTLDDLLRRVVASVS